MFVLYDTPSARDQLYPFSLTRPLAELYMGAFTLKQWWQNLSGIEFDVCSASYLQTTSLPQSDRYICVDATVLPTPELITALKNLNPSEALIDDYGIMAYSTTSKPEYGLLPQIFLKEIEIHTKRLQHAADLFKQNEWAIQQQFALLNHSKSSAPIHASNLLIHPENVMISEGAKLMACILNATDGPIYVGKNAHIMEGACIHGPVSIGENCVVKMGAKIYPGTSIGQYCVAGGEIKNSIIMPFSNKAHDGYLGDSVIGSWCNLGAGTTNSNVKNTAGPVKLWHQEKKQFIEMGIKAGLMMGDYSRSAINTAFNTGTTVGVCCNVFGEPYPQAHVPSFTWGNNDRYKLPKAVEHIHNWKQLKGQTITTNEAMILQHIFDQLM